MVVIALGIALIKIGLNNSQDYLFNLGIVLLCVDTFYITILMFFSYVDCRKKLLKEAANLFKFNYNEQELVFEKGSTFYNLRRNFTGYKAQGTNSINGILNSYIFKFYKYTMISDFVWEQSYNHAIDLDFYVIEIKTNYITPNIICLPKWTWLSRFKKNVEVNSPYLRLDLHKKYYCYSKDISINKESDNLINNILNFIIDRNNKIGIEFCDDRIIVFQYGSKINKKKIVFFLEIAEFIISNIQSKNQDFRLNILNKENLNKAA